VNEPARVSDLPLKGVKSQKLRLSPFDRIGVDTRPNRRALFSLASTINSAQRLSYPPFPASYVNFCRTRWEVAPTPTQTDQTVLIWPARAQILSRSNLSGITSPRLGGVAVQKASLRFFGIACLAVRYNPPFYKPRPWRPQRLHPPPTALL
jgi:hypothetical protein